MGTDVRAMCIDSVAGQQRGETHTNPWTLKNHMRLDYAHAPNLLGSILQHRVECLHKGLNHRRIIPARSVPGDINDSGLTIHPLLICGP